MLILNIRIIFIFNIFHHRWVKLFDVKNYHKLGQRKGKPGGVYRTPKSKRIAPPKYRNLDFA